MEYFLFEFFYFLYMPKPFLSRLREKFLGTRKKRIATVLGSGIAAIGLSFLLKKSPTVTASQKPSQVHVVAETKRESRYRKPFAEERIDRRLIVFAPLSKKPSIEEVRGRIPFYQKLLSVTKPPEGKGYPSPERKLVLQLLTAEFAEAYGFKPEEILAHVFKESSFRESIVGASNDRGLMQITPSAQEEILLNGLGKINYGRVWDVFDPICNLDAGIHYLQHLMTRTSAHGIRGKEAQLQRARAYFNVGVNNFLSNAKNLDKNRKEKDVCPRKIGRAYAQRLRFLEKQFKGTTYESLFYKVREKFPEAFQ